MQPDKRQALLTELARGVQLAFDNAEKLFHEGGLLRKSGFLAPAYFAHQISLEECGKIELIGAWITNLFLGGGVDVRSMTRAFRSHEAKNHANAYFASLTPEEREASEKGDTKRALEAFAQLQKRLHEELNTAKNASLYIDYRDGSFSAPSEVISEEAVVGIAAVNAYFLGLTDPKVRVAERMAKDDNLYHAALKGFAERLEELRTKKPKEISAGFRSLYDEMMAQYRAAEKAEKQD